MPRKVTQQDVNAIVEKMVVQMESNSELIWKKRHKGGCFVPQNGFSNRPYQGFNVLRLMVTGFNDHRWMTFNQIKKNGGKVKRQFDDNGNPVMGPSKFDGKPYHLYQEPTEIVFNGYAPYEKEENGKKVLKMRWVFQIHNLYNFEQTEGLNLPSLESLSALKAHTPIEEIKNSTDEFLDFAGVNLKEGIKYSPCYVPALDEIRMPPIGAFEASDNYYGTLFHEIIHSTGSESRCNRKGITDYSRFGDDRYSYEELVAELGSAFLCWQYGIDVPEETENSAAYLKDWLSVLKDKPQMLMQASSEAHKAVKFFNEKKVEKVTV